MAGTERYVRNSTADFLVFTKDSETDGIEVRVQDHEVWLTQKGIGQLFEVDRSVVAKHLRNIFAENELSESTTCAKFAQVADNGKNYHYKFYSLPAIIAVGYRTNSTRATQFRQLCNGQTTQKDHMGLTSWKNAPKREDSQSRCFCCKKLFAARRVTRTE